MGAGQAVEEETIIRGFDTQCGSHCAVRYRVRNGVLVQVDPDPGHPNDIGPCPKGMAAPEMLYNSQRLLYPMRRTRPKGDPDPGWRRIGWNEALEIVAREALALKTRYGPESLVFYRGAAGGTSIGGNQGWIKRLACAFGTPNFITTGHICNWHRDSASSYTYGVGLPFPDFERTGCHFMWGHNPQATYRVSLAPLEKALGRGVKLVVVDPRRTPLAAKADLWLPVRPGTDGALALGLIRILIEEGIYDREFVSRWTNAPFLVRADVNRLLSAADFSGAEGESSREYLVWNRESGRPEPAGESSTAVAIEGTFQVTLSDGARVEVRPAFEMLRERARPFSPERVAGITGIQPADLQRAAHLLIDNRPSSYWSYNGVEQQTNVTYTNRALCVLYSLTGDFDRPGGNVLWPRLKVNKIEGHDFLEPEVAARRLGSPERPLGKAALSHTITAYDAYEAMLRAKPYPVRGLIGFGGNLITCTGDSLTGRRALQSLDFYAQAEFFLTPAAQLADLVLPAATPWESDQLQVGFRGRLTNHIQYCPAVVKPQGEVWPDLKLIFELGKRLGLGERFWNGDVEAGWNHQLAPTGITVEQLKRTPGGVSIPLEGRYQKYQEGGFLTPTGRIEIFSQKFRDRGYDPLPRFEESLATAGADRTAYPLLLINSKLQHFCHGQHRAVPSLRREFPHPFLEIHPDDAASRGVRDRDWVRIETGKGSIKVQARVTEDIVPGVVNTQHGWWQSCPELGLPGYDPYSPEGANVNLLFGNDLVDPISGSVPHKGYPCQIRKA